MAIGAIAFLFLAHDHRNFRVGFPFDEAVDHLHAGTLQRARPEQVLLLVKARLELDDRGHRLARLGGIDQRPDDRGLLARAIQCLLDRDDIGIGRRLLQEFDHHLERFIGVMDQYVLVANGRKTVSAMIANPLGKARAVGRELEIRPIFLDQYIEIADADQTVDPAFGGTVIQQILAQHRDHRLGKLRPQFQPDDIAAPSAFDRAAEIAHQVLGFFLDLDVAVANDPEQAAAVHHIAGEENVGKFLDHRFDRDIDRRFAGQADEARQTRGNHHQFPDPLIVGLADQVEHQAQPLVGNERKGMGRVKRLRRQHREYLVDEMLAKPGFRSLGQILHSRDKNILVGQLPGQRRPDSLLVLQQQVRALCNRVQLLRRGQAVGRPLLDLLAILTDQSGKADHEKFVEVAAGNRQEAQPLEQRMGAVFRFLDHPLVEAQPADFAVEIALAALFGREATGLLSRQDVRIQ